MFYLEFFQALGEAKIRYLVAGGVALNLHGVPRMTADLDLLLALDADNLAVALAVFARQGLVPSLPVPAADLLDPANRLMWKQEKNLIAFPFHNPARPFECVDVLIHAPLDFDAAWSRRARRDVAGTEVPLLGLQDLIEQKRLAGRAQDLADVQALERLQRRKNCLP
jgi:hypothetical protein